MEIKKKYRIVYKLSQLLNCKIDVLTRLSDEQLLYINYRYRDSSILEACPGSGKTEVIGIKSAFEIKRWNNPNGGIAITTFTTSAANELNKRIRKYADLSVGLYPHFIGTFDSWLHNFILQPYSHYLTKYPGKDGDKSVRIIDDDSDAGFLSNQNYNVVLTIGNKTRPIKATEFTFDENWQLVAKSDQAKALFPSLSQGDITSLRRIKLNLLRDGFATYSDAEMLCYFLLNRFEFLRQKLSQRFPVIIIDECQDLSKDQLDILEFLRAQGTQLHFVGDLNQSIYDFREVNPQIILAYIRNIGMKTLRLTNNYRSCQPIVTVSDRLINNQYPSRANIPTRSQTPCVVWQYDVPNRSLLPARFEQFVRDNGLNIEHSAVLARGRTTLGALRVDNEISALGKCELIAAALHFWHKDNRTGEDIKLSIYCIGRAICLLAFDGRGDKRNQYCPENYTTIEWRLHLKKLLIDGRGLYPFQIAGRDALWREWIPTLKIFLEASWGALKGASRSYNDISAKIKSPSGKAANLVNTVVRAGGAESPLRLTTIHSVKGETLDAVMLVSHQDKRSKGGHFSHWFREGNYDEEHIRFAYVACSRPQHLLVVATPTLNAREIALFQGLGFQVV